MNHLQNALSPYLLQHADQPVHWYPWGPEAFAKAKADHKPIFLSIGYSTCHWCHVMAAESFDDQEVAAYLNAHFVAIKVDREERPDVDAVYMAACLAMTGSGGWPLTIVMDGEGEPFFAATYLPKEGRYGRPGLLDLLKALIRLWDEEDPSLTDRQAAVRASLQGLSRPSRGQRHEAFSERSLQQGLLDLSRTFDAQKGGFGQAPKFPTPHKIFFLQALQARFQSEPAQVMARKTLDAMALGGLFDPIAGGFARYATDRDWLIPHFEKMLIDNALLAIAYLRQYQLEKSPGDRYVADRTLAYMANRLSSPGEAFYSAQDADALGQEGAYYALTFQDLREALGPARAEDFAAAYGFTDEGNFQGTNIPNQLHRQKLEAPDPSFLADFKKLDAYRQARMPLHRDEKILLGWNALAIYAFVVAFEVTGEPSYLDLAQAKRQLLEDKMRRPDGAYVRAERQGKQSGLAQLGDLASLARLDLALYRVGGQGRQLRSALALLESIQEDFYDAQGAGYYMTSARVADLIIRPKEWLDGAHMSANALMVGLLHEAWLLTGFASYRDQLDALLDAFKEIPGLSAVTHAHFFFELAWVMAPSRSLVTTARPEALLPWQTSLQDPSPYRRTLLRLDQESREIFKDRPSFVHAISDAGDQWMLCQDSSCQRPVASFADLQD